MDYPKFVVSNQKEEFISIQRVVAFSVNITAKNSNPNLHWYLSYLKKNLRFRTSQDFLIFGYDAVLNYWLDFSIFISDYPKNKAKLTDLYWTFFYFKLVLGL